jgi:opacity protein-like surface antigen
MFSRIARFTAILLLLTIAGALPAAATDFDALLWRAPVSGGHAMSDDWAGFRLWASGEGFSVGRRSAGYGVQGGAALPLTGRIGLTASYRLTGFALGDHLGAELDDVASHSLAPILGVDIEF